MYNLSPAIYIYAHPVTCFQHTCCKPLLREIYVCWTHSAPVDFLTECQVWIRPVRSTTQVKVQPSTDSTQLHSQGLVQLVVGFSGTFQQCCKLELPPQPEITSLTNWPSAIEIQTWVLHVESKLTCVWWKFFIYMYI